MNFKKPKRKEQIQEIAQNMFRERGYTATSMRDLANAVGIEAASLYNHIKSKEEILQNICFGIADEFFQAINKVKILDLPPDKKLTMAIKEHVLVITNNLDAAAVFLHEWRFLSEPHLGNFKRMRNNYEKEFQKILSDGVELRIFKPMSSKLYCLALFSSLNWIYDWYNPSGELSPQQLGEQFSYLMLEGIKR